MKKLLFSVFMLLFLLAACSPAATPTAAPTEPPAKFPTGKFVEPGNDQAGFIFNEDGTWSAFSGIYTQAKGTYSATSDLYTEQTNDENCPAPMSYKYSFDGKTLKFQLIDESSKDTCDARKQGFDNKEYILSK